MQHTFNLKVNEFEWQVLTELNKMGYTGICRNGVSELEIYLEDVGKVMDVLRENQVKWSITVF